MQALHDAVNRGRAYGEWGERMAADYLRCHGYEIVDRNSRPVARDHRLEIDIVAWDRQQDVMVFVEVKQHAELSCYGRRLRSINRRKQANLRRACNAWRRLNDWCGAYRFDVLEVYGVPEGGRPVVDHIPNVALFARPERFVRWCEEDES